MLAPHVKLIFLIGLAALPVISGLAGEPERGLEVESVVSH